MARLAKFGLEIFKKAFRADFNIINLDCFKPYTPTGKLFLKFLAHLISEKSSIRNEISKYIVGDLMSHYALTHDSDVLFGLTILSILIKFEGAVLVSVN